MIQNYQILRIRPLFEIWRDILWWLNPQVLDYDNDYVHTSMGQVHDALINMMYRYIVKNNSLPVWCVIILPLKHEDPKLRNSIWFI